MEKSLRILVATTCLLLLLVEEGCGKLELSLYTDYDATLERKFTILCRDSVSTSGEDNSINMMAMTESAGSMNVHDSDMKMQMEGVESSESSFRFELNNTIIYPNSTLLHNYSVLSEERDDRVSATFQLNVHEVFFGNFTCRRNYTMSNDVLLAYLPMTVLDTVSVSESSADTLPERDREPLFSSVVIGMGFSLSIMTIATIALSVGLVVVCCVKREKSSKNQLKSAYSVSWNHPGVEGSIQTSRSTDQPRGSFLQFTANGYAVPQCSQSQLSGRTRGKAAAALEEQTYTDCANDLSNRAIVKVLKYLLHPSNCSRQNCLCKEVKAEYNALLNEQKSSSDPYPSHSFSDSVAEASRVKHDVMQGRCQTASLYSEDISCDEPRSSIITIKETHSSSSSLPLECKDGCSWATDSGFTSLEYPKLLPASSPVFEMSYVDPPESVTFDCKGGRYFNPDHGIGLKVPPGAVPAGEQVTIEIGASLSCPVIFPAETKPVSAMLTMCVVDNPNYTFLKPVEVRLSHCLDITTKEDINDLEIRFLKSGHNLFCLHKAEGRSTFEPGSHCGVLSTTHFCCFCICANKKKADLSKINYRLIKVIPSSMTSLRWKARYCVTFFLPTCLRALEKQYCPNTHNIQSLQRFKFTNCVSSEEPYVGISFERRVVGGWNLALESPDKIYAKDVDFWKLEQSDLEQMEAEELYPPRFMIDVCGTQAHATGQLWVNFSGMMKEFKSELILDASRGLPQFTFPTPPPWAEWTTPNRYSFPMVAQSVPSFSNLHSHTSAPCLQNNHPDGSHDQSTVTMQPGSSWSLASQAISDPPSEHDLINKVAVKIPTKWRHFGTQLGLEQAQLDVIEEKPVFRHNPHIMCFSEVISEWKRRGTSPYKWSTVFAALESQLVGENVLAHKLQEELESGLSSSQNTIE